MESAFSRWPKRRAAKTKMGSSRRISRQRRQFITSRKVTPPAKVASCLAESMGVSVTMVWMTVTSFMRRDKISPVRRFAKKLSDNVWR